MKKHTEKYNDGSSRGRRDKSHNSPQANYRVPSSPKLYRSSKLHQMKPGEQDYCFRPRTSTPIDFCMEDDIPHHYLDFSQSNTTENQYEMPRMESVPASPVNSRKKSAYMSQSSDKSNNMEGIAVKKCRSRMKQGGVCCEHCNNCLIDLKRQALRIMFPGDSGLRPVNYIQVEEMLQVPENFRRYIKRERCDVCETPIRQLKQEAVAMIQSIQQAQSASSHPADISALVGSYNIGVHHHSKRSRSSSRSNPIKTPVQSPVVTLPSKSQSYIGQNARSRVKHLKHNQFLSGSGQDKVYIDVKTDNMSSNSRGPQSITMDQSAGIFSRAAQKMSKKKKRHQPPDPEPPPFPTNFCDIIRCSSPPAPPCLLRGLGRLLNPGVGKVKVMLKICSPIIPGQTEQGGRSFLTIDPRRKQVTVHDPAASGYITSSNRRAAVAAPKMFAFDGIFSPDDSLSEVCSGSLSEILQSVIEGADGCLFSYGHSKLGKSFTMIGKDHSPQTLGVIPCAISWLFKLISEQKESTGARFSVRVSAVEVSGTQENLNDLLADFSKGADGCGSNGVYLREDPICGTQLENQSELRAPTADRAAFYFDAALASRNQNAEDGRSSHLLFTLHVYQYRIEKANRAGLPGVAGGRSRLHLIDLGSTAKSKDPNNASLSLSALGNVIMALLNGQRHLPHRDSKIAQLLRDSLGNTTCRTCIIVHVSSALPHHTETLQVIQMAARMHRMKRRKAKQISSASSEDSSTDGSGQFNRPYKGMRMGTLREDMFVSSSHSDPDNYTCTSSSEQSCDTAIYLGSHGHSLSDRDFTDNEGPPRSVPRTNPRLPRRPGGSRSSGDEGSASDSGRSMTYSDHRRLMKPRMGAPKPQSQYHVLESQSAPCSPQHHPQYRPSPVVKSRYLQHYQKQQKQFQQQQSIPPSIGYTQIEQQAEANKRSRNHVSRHQRPPQPHSSPHPEQWIDGPVYAEPVEVLSNPEHQPGEQWIDGPRMTKQPAQSPKKVPQSPKPDASKKKLKNVVVSSEERWIDGPREMITSNKTSSSSKTPRDIPPSSPSPKLKHASSSGLKQAVIKQIDSKLIRPDSMISTDSNISTHVEAASSRPVSISSNDGTTTQIKDTIDISENMVVKPFVRDWVEKHHNDADVTNIIVNSDNQVIGNMESVLHHRKDKLHDSLLRKLHTSASSGQSSPIPGRMVNTLNPKLLKANSPKHHTNRVTEWVKSVSNDNPNDSVSMMDAETNTDQSYSAKSDKLNVTLYTEPEVNIVDSSCEIVDNNNVSTQDSFYERISESNLEIDQSENMYTSISEYDNCDSVLEPCIQLLRKPDGASNPNLSTETFVESGIYSELSENIDNISDKAPSQFSDKTPNQTPEKTTSILSGYKPEKDMFMEAEKSSIKPVKSKPALPHGLVKLSTVQLPTTLTTNLCQTSHQPLYDFGKSPEKKNRIVDKDSKCAKSKSGSKQTTKPLKNPVQPFVHSSPKLCKSIKKEKEMLVTQRIVNLQMSDKKQCNDSDSGNDSGIVAVDSKKLLSPYSKITKPRTPSHSSSGHGSDNSSSISTDIHSSHHGSKSDKIHGGTSSGYESMLRESEASCSEAEDLKYMTERKRNALRKAGKRSRSAPNRVLETTLETCKLSPISKISSPYHESRLAAKLKEDHVEMKNMTVKEAEKYQRKRYEEENLVIVHEEVARENLSKTVIHEENESADWRFGCRFWKCFSCKSRDRSPTQV